MTRTALVSPPAPPPPPDAPPPKRKRRSDRPPKFLQAGEVDRFFVVIVSPRDRAVFQLMYRAGLRV